MPPQAKLPLYIRPLAPSLLPMSTETAEISTSAAGTAACTHTDQQHLAFIHSVQRLLACHQAMQERFPEMDLPFAQAAIRAAQVAGMLDSNHSSSLLELAQLSQDLPVWLHCPDPIAVISGCESALAHWEKQFSVADAR